MQVLTTLKPHSFALWLPQLTEYPDALNHPGCNFHGLNEFREHFSGKLTLFLQIGYSG